MTEHNVEVLTARLVDLDAQIEELKSQREDTVAALTDAVEVGGRLSVGDQIFYRVAQRKTFDIDKAREILPAALIEQATVPTLDVKALKELMPPTLVRACMTDGAVYVTKAAK